MNPRVLTSVLAATVLASALAGCASDTEKVTTDDGVKLIKKGTLTVCTHLPYEPFQYKDGGETVGFDVELMDLVAKELDVEQKIYDTPFEGIETGQAMSTGKCDIAAAGMTITDERAKVMDFADPYFDATQALLVPAGSDIKSLEDLAGKSLAVQVGTTGQKYATDKAPDDVELRDFEDLALLTQAVKNGQVDAGINDNTVLYDYVSKNPQVEVAAEFDTGEQYGFAVAKGDNDELIKVVNEVLKKAEEDGTYDKIYKKYFGDAPAQ